VERRLTAILAADVVGYSRLVGEDETRTIAALRRMRGEVFEPQVGDPADQQTPHRQPRDIHSP
jgi:class 3 adenylate cyclase